MEKSLIVRQKVACPEGTFGSPVTLTANKSMESSLGKELYMLQDRKKMFSGFRIEGIEVCARGLELAEILEVWDLQL